MPKKNCIKLKEGFFRQEEFKNIRKLAGGNTYTIILLKIYLLSVKNEGKILFKGTQDTLEKELAVAFDEEVENVKMTLLYCLEHSLIEKLSEEEFVLTAVQSNKITD